MPQLRSKQKYFLSLFLVIEIFITSATPALAGLFGGGVSIPSASSIAADLEKRYHIDLGGAQSQGENFNVSANKQPTPEVLLFFNPNDPKPGEKLTAKAFPMYFSSSEENMYYTWYLKRSECGATNNPSADIKESCDRDDDGKITRGDWKVEAAQIIAQNGYDPTSGTIDTGDDNDGYKARFGGNNKLGTIDYCYVNDPASGKNYELAKGTDTEFGCASGKTAVCLVGKGEVNPGELDVVAGGGVGAGGTGGTGSGTGDGVNGTGSGTGTGGTGGTGTGGTGSVTGETFEVDDTNTCAVAGLPYCDASGIAKCNIGTPRCMQDPTNGTDCGSAVTSCSSTTLANAAPYCRHLFPNAPGATSGDGSFGDGEEDFWVTNPFDPDTADNGNKDEANVVGLGVSSFTWNYSSGDQVGVAVEGMSMIPTKHDDSSFMIMWAFPKKDCPLTLADGTGSYTTKIKGYDVLIPTADFDLNKCIERNLVDPTEGGQATNLTVSVKSSSETPINDESGDGSGDVVTAEASVSNSSRSASDVLFDWKVEISNTAQFRPGPLTADITADLQALNLLGNIKGNALDSISVKLDLLRSTSLGGRPLSAYLSNDAAYLRFTTRVSENFTRGVIRKGRSDVIVKFSSTGKKIVAYKAEPVLAGSDMQVQLPSDAAICNEDPLDRSLCRVIRNEIIGLKVDPTGLTNFKWTINGTPLTCGRTSVSPNCEDGQQKNINFFPVSGNVGDTYTVTVMANDVTSSKSVTLSRSFNVVAPTLYLESLDKNSVWKKLLGQYKDITGRASVECPGGLCNEYSASVFQTVPNNIVGLKATFLPSFLASTAERLWQVDGETRNESASGQISFTADKPAPNIYNINLSARVVQSAETRRALLDVWGISPLDSPEINFSSTNEVEVLYGNEEFVQGPLQGPRKYFAAIASYIPNSVLFSLRIMMSVALIVFTAGVLFTIIPERNISYGPRK